MRRRPHLNFLLIGLFFVGGWSLGCGEDGAELPPGNISLSWLIGSTGCESASVTTMAIYLHGGAETELFTYDCGSSDVLITSIPPGSYEMSLRGRDSTGIDRFGGEAVGIVVRSEGTTTVPTVRLSALPAVLWVNWYFENGRMCHYNEIESVDIALFQNEQLMENYIVDCDAGFVQLDDVQAEAYIIDLVGRTQSGVAVFSGQNSITLDRGDVGEVEIQMAPIGSPGTGD